MPLKWLLPAAIIWLLLIGVGESILQRHTTTPGRPAVIGGNWPSTSTLTPGVGQPSLLMWCHPHCPCTRASLQELAELVHRDNGRTRVRVIFVRPPGCSEAWVEGELWRQAARIPGVQLETDTGEEARRFRVTTSGQVLIFGIDRRLRFNGGLTTGRGHVEGHEAVNLAIRQLQDKSGNEAHLPVYGCALLSSEEWRELETRWTRALRPERKG